MKIKRIITGVFTCALVCSVVPYANYKMPSNMIITASAEKYAVNGVNISYNDCGDYLEITGCDKSVVSIDIPSEINGVPVTVIKGKAFANCTKL